MEDLSGDLFLHFQTLKRQIFADEFKRLLGEWMEILLQKRKREEKKRHFLNLSQAYKRLVSWRLY